MRNPKYPDANQQAGTIGGVGEANQPRNQIEALEKECAYYKQMIEEQKEELLTLYRRLNRDREY